MNVLNHLHVSRAVARELQTLGLIMAKTAIFLGNPPAEAPHAGLCKPGDRKKCWGEIGAFFGGILGILCGFVLSFTSGLGSLPMSGMVLVWLILCLTGALVAGGLSALCAGFWKN